MLAEAQRAAMLTAMGIEVYRLRAAPGSTASLRIAVDAQSRVCVDGIDGASAERLFALLPAVLGVAPECVRRDADVGATAVCIEIDPSALPRDGAGKRRLWQALKPLARQLQHPA
jgi:hypothetical protein